MASSLNAILWLFAALATVAVALRLSAARTRRTALKLDDWVMGFGLILNIVAVAFTSVAVHYGLGRNVRILEKTSPQNIPKAAFWGGVANMVGIFADTVPKLSVALLVNRLLNPAPAVRVFHLIFVSIVIALAVVLLIVNYTQCTPVAHQWNPYGVPGSCWNPVIFQRLAIFTGSYSGLVDLYFSVYPSWVISRLKMQTRKKILAAILMSFGFFTAFTTIYKTAYALPKLTQLDLDITKVLGVIALWGLLEASVTIIAGSIPTWGFDALRAHIQAFSRLRTWVTSRMSSSDHSRPPTELDEVVDPDRNGVHQRREPPPKVQGDSILAIERSAAR